jgi:glutamate/tyrosine decarboxylase-like PLP-dependent enzyme
MAMIQRSTTFAPALEAAFKESLAFVDAQSTAAAGPSVDVDTLRARFRQPLNDDSADAREVIEGLARDAEGGILGTAGGRAFAWAIGGTLPAALAADWLTSAWDQNAALYACSPAASIVEEVVGAWLKDLLHVPQSASFALVTGCQMAHATCLAAARHSLLAQRDWDVERRGLYGAPPIRIISSANRHGSIDRAVRLLGLGTEHVEYLAPSESESLDDHSLKCALGRDDGRPSIVLLQAGDINTGAFDSFASLIPVAHKHGAWVHVDGAFGLWAAASPTYRHLLKGAEAADSWATDGHKWLNTPFDCGYAFVSDPEAHRASMSTRAPYIAASQSARDQIDWNPEWSRRARGFSSYAALRQLGRNGIAEMIDRTCRYARELVDGIGALDGAEVLWYPVINQGLVRFKAARADAEASDHDVRTSHVIEEVARGGQALFGPTTWRGKSAMRISVLNWQTSASDVARAIAAVAQSLAKC